MAIISYAVFFLVICFCVGVWTTLKWLLHAMFAGPTEQRHPTPLPNAHAPVSTEKFRPRIEELYFQKKFSLETLREILQILGLQPKEVSTKASVETLIPTPVIPAALPRQATTASTATIAPAAQAVQPSAFLSSDNIKTLLISGSALFVLSAYLFVRSYWASIPDIVKFAAMAGMTFAIYAAGRSLLRRSETPKTAETLLLLALSLIPFNVIAANLFIFEHALDSHSAWSLGLAALAATALLNAARMPTVAMGALIVAALSGSVYTGGEAAGWILPDRLLGVSLATLLALSTACVLEIKETLRKGAGIAVNGVTILVLILSFFNGFFLDSQNQIAAALSLVCIGVAYAIEARLFEYAFAYGAGLCFMGAGVIFLHHFQVPTYKYGLFFVPASLAATLRAWAFERVGRKGLAAPYFHLGQLAITASLISILPSFAFYSQAGFPTLMLILTLAAFSYAATAILYKRSFFTYACGVVVLLAVGSVVSHEQLPFFIGLYLFSGAAWVFLVAGLLAGHEWESQIGEPLTILGLGTLSLILAFFAAQWAQPIFGNGLILLPDNEVQSGIIVGLLCAAAYGLLAYVKKQAALFYPALVSSTLVYLFVLEKMRLPVDLAHVFWIAPASLGGFYLLRLAGWSGLARCFAVWAEIIFAAVAWDALLSSPAAAYSAVMICTLVFLPCLVLEHADLTTAGLLGLYLAHFLWFRQSYPQAGQNISQYAFELVAINCGVVFLRTLIGFWRPALSMTPFRIVAVFFSVLSMLLALNDHTIAWQVYLAYGLLAIAVSFVHYEARYVYIGTTLLLAAYELYLSAQHVELTEAYSAPAGLYFIACGYLCGHNRESRNALYILGQIVLYAPSFAESVSETWQWHGIFLGAVSIAVMLFGMSQRNKLLTFGSFSILLANGYVQSRQFFNSVPRWIYLGLGGVGLVALGGFSEFQRETFIRLKQQFDETLENWD